MRISATPGLHGGGRPWRYAGHSRRNAYLLMELLVYMGIVVGLLSLGCVALFRCIDSSIALRHSADDVAGALQAGERWRSDVRAAAGNVRLEDSSGEQTLSLPRAPGGATYRCSTNGVFRRVGEGPWVRLLANVKASKMEPDRRQNVAAWRWELELRPQAKGTVKPSRIRPLFTFLAVPES